jgi:uncharacterized repeat protein (TIGR03803 family)
MKSTRFCIGGFTTPKPKLHTGLKTVIGSLLMTLTMATCSHGQTMTILHNFDDTDGIAPQGDWVLKDDILYGAEPGDTNGGSVYSVKIDGTDFTTLASFAGGPSYAPGAQPNGVTLANGVLYGTTYESGSNECYRAWAFGSIFGVSTSGGFVEDNVTSAASECGMSAGPIGGLIYNNGAFYFASSSGFDDSPGPSVLEFTPGSLIVAAHPFTNENDGIEERYQNVDGKIFGTYANEGALTTSGNMVYGTAEEGGLNNEGIIFSMHTNGSSYTILHNFGGGTDGEYPNGSLLLIGGTLYGVTILGGTNDDGAVYSISTNGSNYKEIHSFENTDGAAPCAGLTAVGTTLYGSTGAGNAVYGDGTIFAVNTDGSAFQTLYFFKGSTSDGRLPEAPLIYHDGVLYGTTAQGGLYGSGGGGYGTVFAFTVGCTNWDWWTGDYTTNDSGIDHHNGAAHGSLTYSSTAISGESFDFNGSSTYLDFGTSAGNFGTNDYVIDLWVNTTATVEQAVIGKRPACGLGNYWDIRLTSTGLATFVQCEDSSGTDYTPLESITKVNANGWHEITAVRQGKSVFLYVDANLEAQATAASVVNINNTAHCEMANDPCIAEGDGTHYFDGLIDEIRFTSLCK